MSDEKPEIQSADSGAIEKFEAALERFAKSLDQLSDRLSNTKEEREEPFPLESVEGAEHGLFPEDAEDLSEITLMDAEERTKGEALKNSYSDFSDEEGSLRSELGKLPQKLKAYDQLFELLSEEQDFSNLIAQVLNILQTAIPSEAGSILEVDYRRGDLFFSATSGTQSDNLMAFRIPKGTGIAGFVADTQQSYILGKAKEDHRHLDVIGDSVGFEVKNLLSVPIVIRGKTFGVIELLNKLGRHPYSQEDIELISDIANRAGTIIEAKIKIQRNSKNSNHQRDEFVEKAG